MLLWCTWCHVALVYLVSCCLWCTWCHVASGCAHAHALWVGMETSSSHPSTHMALQNDLPLLFGSVHCLWRNGSLCCSCVLLLGMFCQPWFTPTNAAMLPSNQTFPYLCNTCTNICSYTVCLTKYTNTHTHTHTHTPHTLARFVISCITALVCVYVGVSSGSLPCVGVSSGSLPCVGVSSGSLPCVGVSSGSLPCVGVSSGSLPCVGVSSGFIAGCHQWRGLESSLLGLGTVSHQAQR